MPKLFVLLLFLFPLSCFAQFSISGRVLNHSDKKPVANASVFLGNSSVGGTTSDDGTFTLNHIKPGKYDLIISVIGFETHSQSVAVNKNNITLPDIEISPQSISLAGVDIKANKNDPNRQQYLGWFEDEFLGRTDLGRQCRILNPDALDLDYDQETKLLTASSYDFLEIENESLGYRLKYLLNRFVMDNKDEYNRKIHYDGSVLFEPMKGTSAQERRWQKRRQEVYEGSEMHFLRAALNNRISEEGFKVLQEAIFTDPKKKSSAKITQKLMPFPLKSSDIIRQSDQDGIYAFGCENDALYITYNKKHHFVINDNTGYLDSYHNTESTLVNFTTPFTFFDNNGGIINPNNLSFRGVWGRERIGGLLPVDYEPQNYTNNDTTVISKLSITDDPLHDILQKFVATVNDRVESYPSEKLYVQFDKPSYAIGDTIWLKAWLFNASSLELSAKSVILNVDIANEKNVIVKQYKLPVQGGLSWGNISIDSSNFKTGTYTLRAYTSWMRNFNGDGFFYKQFAVSDPGRDNLLVNLRQTLSNANAGYNANIKLQFADINKTVLANTPMQLQIETEKKRYSNQRLITDANGNLDVNLVVTGKEQPGVSLIAQTGSKKAIVPIILDSVKNADVQFLPEGGSLVAGLPAHIGFKAIGEDGKSISISGIVVDNAKQEMVTFQSLHNGIGSFNMLPKAGETYIAKVTLPGGSIKEYSFPKVQESGIILQIRNILRSDSVQVFAAATKDIIQSDKKYFLIGKARGIICYSAIIDFHDGYIRSTIPTKLFPSGITHFILATTNNRPLNERLVYIDHDDNLNIQVTTNKPVYISRDSVALHLKVIDNEGSLVVGNFSLAVVDNDQVLTDTLKQENIINHTLLSSDISGYIEGPGYYLPVKSDARKMALDNLLLTQGWVSYDWTTDKKQPIYMADDEFAVRGRVLNGFNKPLKSTKVDLFSKSPTFVKDTVTNDQGQFAFTNFPRVDTPVFFIQTPDRNLNEVIKMDEPIPPAFNFSRPALSPWYVNSDAKMITYTRNRDSINKLPEYTADGKHRLKEVRITGQKIINGSNNLNGSGNADIVIDEKELEQAGKKTWLQVLQEKVKRFREGSFILYGTTPRIFHNMELFATVTDGRYSGQNQEWYFIEDKPVKIIIDGVSIFGMMPLTPTVLPAGYMVFPDVDQLLKSNNAEDIKGIEVLSSNKYSSKYSVRFGGDLDEVAYIEITTRTGGSLLNHANPGRYLFKPIALSWPKEFYKPKYAVKNNDKHLPDLRSIIDWEPNITTDQNGEATVSFYSADRPTTYTIIVQGTDGKGNLGYKLLKINISEPQFKSK